jgi:hypothetical protein
LALSQHHSCITTTTSFSRASRSAIDTALCAISSSTRPQLHSLQVTGIVIPRFTVQKDRPFDAPPQHCLSLTHKHHNQSNGFHPRAFHQHRRSYAFHP